MPGIVYKFENSNVQTFEDNVKVMGEVPFAVYFDFKTTSGKKTYSFDQDTDLYQVSYAVNIAFHRKLNLNKIFVRQKF